MKLGILKDTKIGEHRVILIPGDIEMITSKGYEVFVEKNAGCGAGFSDRDYERAGAVILDSKEEIYEKSDMVAKVKEIEEDEYELIREGQIIFTCIHPAAHRSEVDALLKSKAISFTAEDSHRFGSPNCEAAGKAGALIGLYHLMKIGGGKGVFASGLGAAPGIRALVLGAGNVGRSALSVLHSLGAHCTVADINIGTLREINRLYDGSVHTLLSTSERIDEIISQTDLVLNCVKWPKTEKNHLVTRRMVKKMEAGSVIVDISNDEDGAIETFRETTFENPTYYEEEVLHYCVSNIPGAISKTTSIAYSASVVNHILNIFENGIAKACIKDGYLRRSMTTYLGFLTHEETSCVQDRPWVRPEEILGIIDEDFEKVPDATVSKSNNFYEEELWKR